MTGSNAVEVCGNPSINQLKYENYREQSTRLARAPRGEFYLEAVFIEYAFMEDRLESALRHANAFSPKRQDTIEAKIQKLKKLREEKRGLARKYFSDELLDGISAWKNSRNPLIHELVKQQLSTAYLREFALEGEALLKELKSKVGSFNRAIERQEKARALGGKCTKPHGGTK